MDSESCVLSDLAPSSVPGDPRGQAHEPDPSTDGPLATEIANLRDQLAALWTITEAQPATGCPTDPDCAHTISK